MWAVALRPLRDQLVEIGRSCVHPDHRSGAVMNLMWSGIARYLQRHGVDAGVSTVYRGGISVA